MRSLKTTVCHLKRTFYILENLCLISFTILIILCSDVKYFLILMNGIIWRKKQCSSFLYKQIQQHIIDYKGTCRDQLIGVCSLHSQVWAAHFQPLGGRFHTDTDSWWSYLETWALKTQDMFEIIEERCTTLLHWLTHTWPLLIGSEKRRNKRNKENQIFLFSQSINDCN